MSVAPRQVLLSLHRVPGTGPNLSGVLRAAVGMASAYTYHRVQVVLFGEGVLCGLRQANPAWVLRYVKAAQAHKIPLYAERQSLTGRGFSPEDLTESVEVISSEDYLEKWRTTDVHIRM